MQQPDVDSLLRLKRSRMPWASGFDDPNQSSESPRPRCRETYQDLDSCGWLSK